MRRDAIQPKVLTIRGAPGVGKSTVGKVLATVFPDGAVCEVDTFRAFRGRVDWSDRTQHAVALRATRAAVCAMVSDGVAPVVVIDCFGRDSLDHFVEALGLGADCVRAVSLWAEPHLLEQRLASRHGCPAEVALALVMNDEVRARRVPGDWLLDSSWMAPPDVALAIVAAYRARTPRENNT